MTFKMKLFAILWLAGMVGVLSILLIDLSAVIASLPVRAGTKIPPITPALKLLTLVQPGILLILAVLLGVALAPIDFCINNGIIGTGGIRLCPDRVEALIYWKIGA